MESKVDAAQDWVILASFENRHAAERMLASLRRWDGSRAQFLADLDPGTQHDWLHAAIGEPS